MAYHDFVLEIIIAEQIKQIGDIVGQWISILGNMVDIAAQILTNRIHETSCEHETRV